MNQSEQIIEEARRAGIDLDLLDTNLAERWRSAWRGFDLGLKTGNRHEGTRCRTSACY